MPHRSHHALATTLVAALAVAAVSGRQPAAIPPQSLEHLPVASQLDVIAIEGMPPVTLTIRSNGNRDAIARLTDTSQRALRVFSEWLGPLPGPELTVVDLPWGVGMPGASYASTIETRMRLFAPARDLTAERSLIAALARQFWMTGDEVDAPFREGLVIYSATRGIHAVLEGRNFAAPRFLGDFVPAPIRSVFLSPSIAGSRPLLAEFDEVLQPANAPWRFAPTGQGTAARRSAAALRTLERIIGWPAMQQALSAVRRRAGGGSLTPEVFAAVLAEQRGVSMQWFVRDLVRSSDPIDYAVAEFRSVASDGKTRTTLVVERRGPGVFAGTDRAPSAGPARSVQVRTSFADLSEARAFVDGREQRTELLFDSDAVAISVKIDPDDLLLIDVDRSNNGRLLSGPRTDPTGLRLVLNWVIWLQNVMLTYTAIA